MGWFDAASDIGSTRSGHGHHRAKSTSGRSSSGKHHGSHHSSPRGSGIFGLGNEKHNSSRSSFFGFSSNNHRSSSSYYKRSSRQPYYKRIYAQLRRLLRDLVYYMKKHPVKVFVLVIMPLLTSGAVVGLLAKFGIRLPGGLEKMFGGPAHGQRGGLGGGHGGRTTSWEHERVEGPLGGVANIMGGGRGGMMSSMGGALKMAKLFM